MRSFLRQPVVPLVDQMAQKGQSIAAAYGAPPVTESPPSIQPMPSQAPITPDMAARMPGRMRALPAVKLGMRQPGVLPIGQVNQRPTGGFVPPTRTPAPDVGTPIASGLLRPMGK